MTSEARVKCSMCFAFAYSARYKATYLSSDIFFEKQFICERRNISTYRMTRRAIDRGRSLPIESRPSMPRLARLYLDRAIKTTAKKSPRKTSPWIGSARTQPAYNICGSSACGNARSMRERIRRRVHEESAAIGQVVDLMERGDL